MKAQLVWDGGDVVRIPEEMGVPRDDQMQGTAAERLSELAGRVCYDSLGKGRPSFTREIRQTNDPNIDRTLAPQYVEGYHDHILAVGHGSVLEHFNFTVEATPQTTSGAYLSLSLLNRPGVFSVHDHGPMRITLNLRSVLEWESATNYNQQDCTSTLGTKLWLIARRLAPAVFAHSPPWLTDFGDKWLNVELVKPNLREEKWISLYLSGSRGFSHEQVRHGDFTAISQRSTRYVDESEGEWVQHPLIRKYCQQYAMVDGVAVIDTARRAYRHWAECLERWLTSRGVDRTSARKQARGAARGYLGNALQTEMIFSASVAQWRRMIRQRCSPFADAEIREIYTHVVRELKSSRYGDSFAAFELEPSPDGTGMVAVERNEVAVD